VTRGRCSHRDHVQRTGRDGKRAAASLARAHNQVAHTCKVFAVNVGCVVGADDRAAMACTVTQHDKWLAQSICSLGFCIQSAIGRAHGRAPKSQAAATVIEMPGVPILVGQKFKQHTSSSLQASRMLLVYRYYKGG
jgi:hypothetical protein